MCYKLMLFILALNILPRVTFADEKASPLPAPVEKSGLEGPSFSSVEMRDAFLLKNNKHHLQIKTLIHLEHLLCYGVR